MKTIKTLNDRKSLLSASKQIMQEADKNGEVSFLVCFLFGGNTKATARKQGDTYRVKKGGYSHWYKCASASAIANLFGNPSAVQIG